MTIKDGKYPNKKDLEPRIPHPIKGAVRPDELPLADPADSDTSDTFHKNALMKKEHTGQSAYGANQPGATSSYSILKPGERFPYGDRDDYMRKFNTAAHEQWNKHKQPTTEVQEL